MTLGCFLGLASSGHAGRQEQSLDLIGRQRHVGDSNLYSGQWRLQLASHMTELKLRSDWYAQVPVRVVNWPKLFAQSHQTLFPSQRVGSGGETI